MQDICHTGDGRAEKTIGNSEATERLEMETLDTGLAGGAKGGIHVTRTQRLGEPTGSWNHSGIALSGAGLKGNTQPWRKWRRSYAFTFSCILAPSFPPALPTGQTQLEDSWHETLRGASCGSRPLAVQIQAGEEEGEGWTQRQTCPGPT